MIGFTVNGAIVVFISYSAHIFRLGKHLKSPKIISPVTQPGSNGRSMGLIEWVVLIHKFVTVAHVKRNRSTGQGFGKGLRQCRRCRSNHEAKASKDFWFLWSFLAESGVSIIFILVVRFWPYKGVKGVNVSLISR